MATTYKKTVNSSLNSIKNNESMKNSMQGARDQMLNNGTLYLANTPSNQDIKVVDVTKKSKGSGSSGASGGSNAAYLAYMQKIEDMQKQAADDAYNRNVATLNDAYAQRGELLKDNLNTTLKNLQTDYDASRETINKDATKAFKEAYINKMLSNRNLAQNMAAQGLSGGASETTMAGMENNYGNARNNIQTTMDDNLGNLENLYDKNRNSAYQAYNEQLAQDALTKAQYMTQFEQARQNNLASAYENMISKLMSLDPSYVAGMAGLVQSQGSYTPVEVSAGNTPESVDTQQGNSATGVMNSYYAKLARQLRGNGANDQSIAQSLANEGLGYYTITYILNQLG